MRRMSHNTKVALFLTALPTECCLPLVSLLVRGTLSRHRSLGQMKSPFSPHNLGTPWTALRNRRHIVTAGLKAVSWSANSTAPDQLWEADFHDGRSNKIGGLGQVNTVLFQCPKKRLHGKNYGGGGFSVAQHLSRDAMTWDVVINPLSPRGTRRHSPNGPAPITSRCRVRAATSSAMSPSPPAMMDILGFGSGPSRPGRRGAH